MELREPIPPDFPGAVMFDEAELESVIEVIQAKSPFRYYGPDLRGKVSAFEKAFAKMVGVPYCLAVSSGTAALIVGLRALGIGPGDEVIVPANTFIASAEAVLMCGAIPVFAEVDRSLTLDPVDLQTKITSHTKAVMPVHFGGISCAMDKILEVAERYGLWVIEDCAQACGARYQGRRVGSLGHIGAFSFQINKMITTGEGGAITTSDPRIYERALRAHDHGGLRDPEGKVVFDTTGEAFVGENYRMNELAGALGLAQLAKLDTIIDRMRQVKKAIKEGLGKLHHFQYRKIWDEAGDVARRLILIAETAVLAEGLAKKLVKMGFAAEVPYGGRPVYEHFQIKRMRMWYGEELTKWEVRCPYTEDLLSRSVMVGLGPKFTPRHVEQLVGAIKHYDRSA